MAGSHKPEKGKEKKNMISPFAPCSTSSYNDFNLKINK